MLANSEWKNEEVYLDGLLGKKAQLKGLFFILKKNRNNYLNLSTSDKTTLIVIRHKIHRVVAR